MKRKRLQEKRDGNFFEIFDKKYNKLLNDNECQSSTVANDPLSGFAPVMFSLNDLDIAINKLNQRERG